MGNNGTGLFEGDNLLNQIVNISKAAAYDVTVENVKALQAQNAELIKQLVCDNDSLKAAFLITSLKPPTL